MKITIGAAGGSGITTIEDAQGIVWDEAFSFEECEAIASLLTSWMPTLTAHARKPPLMRLRDAFLALANDGDACVVHCTTTVNGALA